MTAKQLQAARAEFVAYWLEMQAKPEAISLVGNDGCPLNTDEICIKKGPGNEALFPIDRELKYAPCPIKWPEGHTSCMAILSKDGGLVYQYQQAIESGDLTRASQLAGEIAALPWREE